MSIDKFEITEEFFVDIYEHAPDLICAVDLESGTITACNQTYADRLEYEKEEIVGRESLEFYVEDCRSKVQEAYEELRSKGEVENVEVMMECADGSRFDASLSATGIRGSDGEIVGSRSALREITELKEAKRKLEERARRLEQSNRELEQFAYLATHDLQEPLRMVASYTQLLERRYTEELDERAKKYIDYAVDGAKRMKALLSDLLKYSRAGRPEMEFELVALDDVMESVCSNLRVRIGESDAEVVFEGLPEVVGDETQLIQLFQNLVENAIKFQEEGRPRVEIEAETRGEEVCVEVSDNGTGIDTSNADRMFQIFQRLHERGEYDGTGAGLAIVKKIVEQHGGGIEVESTVGEGTTMRVTLTRGGSLEEVDG